MKKFKTKKIKRKKRRLIKFLFLFFFIYAYIFMFDYSKKNKLKKDVLRDDVNYIKFNMIKVIDEKIDNTINKPVNLLNRNIKNATKIEVKKVSKEEKVENKNITESNDEIKDVYEPLVYIYNTHQKEAYQDYSVYDASFELTNKLNSKKIDTYFEENSITTVLTQNKMKYYESYKVSLDYMKKAKEKYSTLNYFFDIHRDSVSKDKSTLNYNNKNYAKLMFVVGKENSNYLKNLENAQKLNEIIISKIPGISRGIMQKEGKGVDGVYNQDFSSNVFLIELGANYNTKDEVINTVNILEESIIEYIFGGKA